MLNHHEPQLSLSSYQSSHRSFTIFYVVIACLASEVARILNENCVLCNVIFKLKYRECLFQSFYFDRGRCRKKYLKSEIKTSSNFDDTKRGQKAVRAKTYNNPYYFTKGLISKWLDYNGLCFREQESLLLDLDRDVMRHVSDSHNIDMKIWEEHLISAWGALGVLGVVFWNHWSYYLMAVIFCK